MLVTNTDLSPNYTFYVVYCSFKNLSQLKFLFQHVDFFEWVTIYW